MNRRRPGWDPRLSTPGRSRLDTNDWYNRLYQSTADEYSDQVRQSEQQKKNSYANTAFGNFMDYVNSETPEFAQTFMSVKVPENEEVTNIPDVIVTPEKEDHSLEDRRRMLKEKKWLNGLKGDTMDKTDEEELNQLDLWHKLVYSEGYEFLDKTDPTKAQLTPQELALQQARLRLGQLGGAPQGYWENTAKKVGVGLFGLGQAMTKGPAGMLELAKNFFFGDEQEEKPLNLIDDITTSFVRKVNEIQVGTSKGKIQRTQEMQLLGQNGIEDLLEIVQYRDNIMSQINELRRKEANGGLSKEEVGALNRLQKQWNDSYLDELHASDKLDALASYDPYEALGPISYTWSKLNRALDVDYAPDNFFGSILNRIDFAYDLGLRDDLAGIKNDLRKFRQARKDGDKLRQNEAIESIQSKLAKFDENAESRKKGWAEDIEYDQKDLERIDNNYKVSEYYNLQDQLAQDLGLFSPKKLLFSSAGLLGSSMSSTPKSLLRYLSWGLAMASSGPAGIAGAAGINLIAGGAQATDENNAEVGLTYQVSDFVNMLQAKGVLDATIEDGRKQLDNKDATLEDVINAFTEGRIMFTDRKVRDAMLNIIGGANQQWAYDMNATAPGVWTEAALTTIPDAYYLKLARFGKAISPKRLRDAFKNLGNIAHEMSIGAGFIPEEELIMLERAAARKGIKDAIIVPMREKIGQFATKAGQAAAKPFQGERTAAVIDYIRNKTEAVVQLGKYIPTSFLKGPKGYPVKRAAKSMATRSVIGMSEEFWEEDVQSIREHERSAGKFGNEFIYGTYNPRLLFDNVADGIRSSWDFIFKDPALVTQEEKEIWREAKLGALGFMLQGGAPAFVQSARGVWQQADAIDLIYQQILNTKAEDDAQIKRGIQFARNARNYDDFERSMQAFDDIERYNRKKNKSAEDNNNPDEAAFADDAIESNREFYKKIYNTYNNPLVKIALKTAGLQEGTEKYNAAVAMIARQQELSTEVNDKTSDVANTINNVRSVLKSDYFFSNYMEKNGIQFTQPARTPQIERPEGKLGGQKKKLLEERQKAAEEEAKKQDLDDLENWKQSQKDAYYKYIDDIFYLASIGSLIEQINAYSQLESLTNKKSDFVKHLKEELATMNKERTDAGYKSLDTIDDVMQYVQDPDLYDMIKDLYRQYDGLKQDRTAMLSILDRMLSPERIVKGETAEEVYQINNMVDTYFKNQESDMMLQQAVEDDFFRLIKHREEIDDYIENFQVNNSNNIYTGFDGKSYIVIPKVDKDGNTYYAKYEYDEDEKEAYGSELPFDKEEFYTSKKVIERDAEREQMADISDEERVELGNRRKRKEARQMDYAMQHRFTDEEYSNWGYTEGENEESQLVLPPSEAEIKARKIQADARAREAQERHEKLLEENPQWGYTEGENTEDELTPQMQAYDRAVAERRRQEELEAERQANLAARQEPQDRVHQLARDGYTFHAEKTKRGKTLYWAKKDGEKKIRITEQEYNQGFQLQIEQRRANNLRSNSFYEYDPRFSVHRQGLIAKRDAYSQVEAIILGSIYDGNEQRFNDLLDYFGTVLTDEQIDKFRYIWLQINDTVAEERESLLSMKYAREARKVRIREIFRQEFMVRDLLQSMESMIFKMYDVYKSISSVQVAEWVDDFVNQRNAKAKGLLKKQLLSHVNGVSKAVQIVAIAKANWDVRKEGSKYIVEAPTGETYDITEFQYSFYEYIKQHLDQKLLEFKLEEQETKSHSFDAFMDFINTLAEAKQLEPEQLLPEEVATNMRWGVVLHGVYLDPQAMLVAIGEIPNADQRDGVGDFSVRGAYATEQDRVVAEIKKHTIANNPKILHHLTTAWHYFVLDDNNKVQLYDRVHMAMFASDPTVGDVRTWIQLGDPKFPKYDEFKKRLQVALVKAKSENSPEIIQDEIRKIQSERNNKVAEYYNPDSTEYKQNSVNFEGYVKYIYDEYNQPVADYIVETVSQQAAYDEIFSNRNKFYLESGNIVDDILRTIFQDKIPVNKPAYKMSDSTFKELCDIAYRKKHQLDRLGIKIITDEVLLTGYIENDQYDDYVAGVPDMLAVDKEGNIYLIDFKTTSGLLPFDKNVDSLSSIDWRKRMSPKEAREYNRNNTTTSAEFDRAQLASYSKQLAMYSELIHQMFGEAPRKMYIAPIYLQRLSGNNPITGKADQGVLKEIVKAEPFAFFEIQPDMSVITTSAYDWSEVDAKLNVINHEFDQARQDIVKNPIMLDANLLSVWNDIVKRVNNINEAIKEAKDGEVAPEDTILSELAKLIQDIQQFNDDVRQFRAKKEAPTQGPMQQNGKGHQFRVEKRYETGELRTMYNNIDYSALFDVDVNGNIIWKRNIQWDQAKKKAFERVTALPDFIENSEWELNVPSYLRQNTSIRVGLRANRPQINLTIRYKEHTADGNVIDHVFGGLMVQVRTQLDDGTEITNQRLQNPLLLKIDSLLFDIDENGNAKQKKDAGKIRIIFTNKSRTNGIVQHNPNNMRPAIEAFQIKDEDLETLFIGDGNEAGVVGVTARGSLGRIKPPSQKDRVTIRGIQEDRSLRDGQVAISMKMPYLEDKIARQNSPIIPFTAKFFTKSDAIFLVDLLANYGKYQNQGYKIKVDGKEYDSPISAHDLLYNTLIRFHAGLETGNLFVLAFAKKDSNQPAQQGDPVDYNRVVATQWGEGFATGNLLPEPFDLRTKDGKNNLYKYLIDGASVWYQNERLMMMGTTSKLDNTQNNPFLGVEQFFKDHPEVDTISYSDSLVFDRRDFDPDGDGSFKGIHGFTWMMRHGWMQSTFTGNIVAPLLSASDVELVEQEEAPEVDEAPIISPTIEHADPESSEPSQPGPIKPDNTADRFDIPDVSDIEQALIDQKFNINLSDAAEISDSAYEDLLNGLDKLQKGTPITPMDRKVAEKRLKRILGKNFPVRFIPQFVEMFADGNNSVGRLTKRGIILSQYAENGTEFHEAFHAVVEVLLPEAARKRLYDHYKKHYAKGNDVSERVVAEGLADLYYDFKMNTPEVKLTWNIFKLFKNIWDYGKALYDLNDIKIAMMFAATDAGVMRAFSVKSGRLADIERRFGKGLDFTVRDSNGKDHVLKQFANFRQIDDFVDVMLYKIIDGAGIDLLGKNIRSLDTRLGAIQTTLLASPEERKKMLGPEDWDKVGHSKEYKKLTIEGLSDEKLNRAVELGKISPLTARNARLFREAFGDWELFRSILEKKIEALGVDKKVQREQRAVEDMDGGEGHNQEEFGHYEQPFYEHSIREDVPTKIRYFLSTIPNRKFADYDDVVSGRVASIYRYNEKGEKERMYLDVKNNSMGYSTYMPYNKVYNTLLRLCHSARNIQDMDDMLAKLGKSDYAMYRIGKAFHRFRRLMYHRWTKDDFQGEYIHKAKVLIRVDNGGIKYTKDQLVTLQGMKTIQKDKMTMLHPSEYTVDEFPQVVRYAHDIISPTGELLHKQGDVIKEAVILTDPDYEQLVVQLFQAVHAQRLNFQHIYSIAEVSANGKPTGRFSYEEQSTSQDYDTQVYPRLWFNTLRSGFGGIFTVSDDGKISVAKNEDGSTITTFGDVARALRNMRTAISAEAGKLNMHRVPVRNTYKDLFNDDDFAEIEMEFVRLLNQAGVPIDVSTLNYMLLVKYPRTSLTDAFRSIFTSTDIDSIEPFIAKDGVLERLQQGLNSENYNLFFEDREERKNENPELAVESSGFVIYGDNGFLTDLAKWVGQYRLANRDSMQIGPNNTKLYTYAQHHSASEAVVELNNVYDDDGNLVEQGLIHDLKQSPYVVSEDGTEGSIIATSVLNPDFNPTHDRIKLATFEGVKLNSSNTGGTKYSEITSREDWLSKAVILQNGNIIFPTLSDKSTWFYLLGFKLPGIDYSNIKVDQLPKFSNTQYSRIFFNRTQFNSKQSQQYYQDSNDVIDQLIRYAYRELALVNQTMNQLGIQSINQTDHHLEENEKIANFHKGTMNGARFAFLTGVYGKYTEIKDAEGNVVDFVLDESVDEFYEFNKHDPKNPERSVLESRERAMRVFFDKRQGETDQQLKARQRSMIANILQHRVKKQLEDLVEKGIIKKLDTNKAKQYKDAHGIWRYANNISDFFGYQNVFLDHKAIDALIEKYKTVASGNSTYGQMYQPWQIESAAIVAYVYDVTAKSIMSKEETQRIFTGFPHFFKWKFDKETGSLVNIIEDESKRHGGEGSTGTSNITDLPNITRTYRCAEIEDYKITSPIIRSIRHIFRDNEYRDALVDILAEQQAKRMTSLARRRPNTFNMAEALLYSGKADGSDQFWAAAARELGIKVQDITAEDYDALSTEEKDRIEEEFQEVLRRLNRTEWPVDTREGKDVRRDMMQADNADAIFAIGTYDKEKMQVSGGTGYAVMRGLIRGIPVYLYDQSNESWYDLRTYRQIDTPALTTHAAVIGTRKLKESGEKAIEDVLKVTLNKTSESAENRTADDILDQIYDEVYDMPLHEVEKKLSNYKDGSYKAIVDKKVEAAVSCFENDDIDVTDGTAYITDKMAENLLRMRGAWDSNVEEAFKYLRGNKRPEKGKTYLSSAKAYKIIMDSLIGTQKYSAFGHRMQHGVPVHFYNKYALFPIFKGISYGFTAELYKKMNDPRYGIDMLMVKQAVKVGQQAGQFFGPEMTEEELKNFSFAGQIYEQQYSMIRRQLNTDPHERDLMAMGTQAAKVALSVIQDNQNYTLSNGEVVRGREIKKRIMDAINALSRIGVNKVNERFFDITRNDNGDIVDKKLNTKKFADFIEGELLNRNADKNILDAVRELKTKDSPILNSVTNMAWIESILISFINKNVIDINLPGNAFYQRSVFGMEGIVGDDQFPVLANGRNLQMINEEGSMDAVVSIDFFYNIIPQSLRYNFDAAKQWLIDNGIISGVKSFGTEWSNAKANIVAYRIPTQAVSSIHALRVVDVLPVLRDTIVLPKEFTKITGSDFDIDKLYCSMVQYNVTKTKLSPTVTYEKSETIYDATRHFDKETNPEQYYQNQLMEMYLALLKDSGKKVSSEESDERVMLGKYAHLLHRPIDNDTDLVKGVLNKIEAGQKKSPVEPFEAGSLYIQSNLKSQLAIAKFGIGPFALNNNNHILTRLYNVSFKSVPNSIITLLGAESLHRDKDRDGNSILSWISAFINAHVDVAKDPYILRLNVNKYTYNLVSLLIRTGFGKDGLYFVAQPILKNLAEEFQNINGDIVDDPSMSPTERWKEAEKEYVTGIDFGNQRIQNKVNKLYGRGNAKYTAEDFNQDAEIFKTLFGIGKDGYTAGSTTLLEKLLTDKSYRIDPNKAASIDNFKKDEMIKIGNVSYSPREMQGFIFIAKKLFDDYADALGDLVQNTKIDTKKHGISFLEQRQYMNRYEALTDYDTNLFDSNLKNMLEDSFIDFKTRHAIPLLKEILQPQMTHFTDQFQEMADKLQDITNNRSTDTRKAIQASMLTYIKQKAMNRVMEQQGIEFNELIRGRNSLANRIQALKTKILSQSKPEYSFYASNGVITNTLLANLYSVPYIPEYGQSMYQFLQLDNSADDDADIENDYIDSFEQMWQSDDEEIKGIARDLAVYAFMTSGDNRGLNKFFKYVPLSLRKDIGYVDEMNKMYRLFASGQMELSPEGFSQNTINVNEFYKNNWRNAKIIPLYKPKKGVVGHKTLYDDVNQQNGQIVKRDSYQIFADYSVRGVNKSTGTYTPYVKLRRPYASVKDADPYLLYRLVGVGREGRDEFPIYALTDSKGVSVRTGTDIYELYEYERDDQNMHVTTGHKFDDRDWSGLVKDMTKQIRDYVKAYPNYTELRIAEGTIEKRYSNDPATGQPITEPVLSVNTQGEQVVMEAAPIEYRKILRQMYNKEAQMLDREALDGRPQPRWSDIFKKFCKAA